MRLWVIPMIYIVASIACGLTLPRLEHHYLPTFTHDMSVTTAQAFLSASGSGMLVLAGIIFSIAMVMVQFSAIAYSPRLVAWFGNDPTMFHSLGIFFATFTYSMATLAWVDRGGDGKVPPLSSLFVVVLLVVSLLLFSRLVQRLTDLQIINVLSLIGNKGRQVIGKTFKFAGGKPDPARRAPSSLELARLGPPLQTLTYSGEPRAIAEFDIDFLVQEARRTDGLIVMACGVGDTVVENTPLLRVHGTTQRLSVKALIQAVHLAPARTFKQDPKYPIRLLVDIAIKALSPAVNDPTTAVQAIDQIEDLLHRLARCDLDSGYARDADGVLRLMFPMPTWEDYLTLAFDEIRQYGVGSLQVARRLRAALNAIADSVADENRRESVRQHLRHLDEVVGHSSHDVEDRVVALQEDRQGLGLSRKPARSY
jgi:uncharacterized membrane protein